MITLNPGYLTALSGSKLVVVWLRTLKNLFCRWGVSCEVSLNHVIKSSHLSTQLEQPILLGQSGTLDYFWPTPFPIRFWLDLFGRRFAGSGSESRRRFFVSTVSSSIASDSAHSPNLALLPQPPRGPRLILHTLRIWPSALRPEPPPLRQTAVLDKRFSGSNRFPHSHITLLPHCSSSQWPTMSCILDRKWSLVFLEFKHQSTSSCSAR